MRAPTSHPFPPRSPRCCPALSPGARSRDLPRVLERARSSLPRGRAPERFSSSSLPAAAAGMGGGGGGREQRSARGAGRAGPVGAEDKGDRAGAVPQSPLSPLAPSDPGSSALTATESAVTRVSLMLVTAADRR